MQVITVKAKIFELLEVILEETNEGSRKLAMDVVKKFDTQSATDSMMQLWEEKQRVQPADEGDREVMKALEKGLFHGYHILRRLEDYHLC